MGKYSPKIKILSDPLETLYISQCEEAEYVPWNHRKTIGTRKRLYLRCLAGFLIRRLFTEIWSIYEYGCKILAEWLLISNGKHQNNGVHWYEKGYVSSKYSCLHFIQFSLFDFFIFFIIFYYSFYRYCHFQE